MVCALRGRLQKITVPGVGEVVSVVLLIVDVVANGKQLSHEEFKKAKKNAQAKVGSLRNKARNKDEAVFNILERKAKFPYNDFYPPTEVATFDEAVTLVDLLDPPQFRAFKRAKLAAPATETQLQPEEAVEDVEEMVNSNDAQGAASLESAWYVIRLSYCSILYCIMDLYWIPQLRNGVVLDFSI